MIPWADPEATISAFQICRLVATMGFNEVVGAVILAMSFYGGRVCVLQENAVIPRSAWGVPNTTSGLMMSFGLLPLGLMVILQETADTSLTAALGLFSIMFFVSGLALDVRHRKTQSGAQ